MAGLARQGCAGQMQGKMVRADGKWAGQGNGWAGHCRAYGQGLMGRFAGQDNGWIGQGQVRADHGRHMLGKMDRADGKWEG